MPYLKHYGLAAHPFSLTPDINLYYPSDETENMLAALIYGVTRGDGLLKVVGKVGAGKTLLSRLLLKQLDQNGINTASLYALPSMTPQDMAALLLKEFGGKQARKQTPHEALQDFLVKEHRKGRRNVLLVDEAQALGTDGLEAIRLLTNLETGTDKLLQIVLFGQEELDKLLHKNALRQLLQRISFGFVLHPLFLDDVDAYVHHRVKCCGLRTKAGRLKKDGPTLAFSPRATKLIAWMTGGVPRLIHVLADKATLSSYADGRQIVLLIDVLHSAKEVQGLPRFWKAIAHCVYKA